MPLSSVSSVCRKRAFRCDAPTATEKQCKQDSMKHNVYRLLLDSLQPSRQTVLMVLVVGSRRWWWWWQWFATEYVNTQSYQTQADRQTDRQQIPTEVWSVAAKENFVSIFGGGGSSNSIHCLMAGSAKENCNFACVSQFANANANVWQWLACVIKLTTEDGVENKSQKNVVQTIAFVTISPLIRLFISFSRFLWTTMANLTDKLTGWQFLLKCESEYSSDGNRYATKETRERGISSWSRIAAL